MLAAGLHIPPKHLCRVPTTGKLCYKRAGFEAAHNNFPPAIAQSDGIKRARQMKTELAQEGFQILCAKYDSAAFEEHGFAGARKDDWLSLKVEGGVSN